LIGTPISEVEIDVALVYRLLENQHPDLKHLPIHLVDCGWDNAMFRLGDESKTSKPGCRFWPIDFLSLFQHLAGWGSQEGVILGAGVCCLGCPVWRPIDKNPTPIKQNALPLSCDRCTYLRHGMRHQMRSAAYRCSSGQLLLGNGCNG
jgi:hypothetical protein